MERNGNKFQFIASVVKGPKSGSLKTASAVQSVTNKLVFLFVYCIIINQQSCNMVHRSITKCFEFELSNNHVFIQKGFTFI